MIGGGAKAKPGEVSLAHTGVLFLDELPEFSRSTLEALRQPIESGKAFIARAHMHACYPAAFQLIAAMNPCKCGYLGTGKEQCRTTFKCGELYQQKISGPILDRIDLHVAVDLVSPKDLASTPDGDASHTIRARVEQARIRQQKRYQSHGNHLTNAYASNKEVETLFHIDPPARALLEQAVEKYTLSARGYYRVLKVAQTITDLVNQPTIQKHHLAEALVYRGGSAHRGHMLG